MAYQLPTHTPTAGQVAPSSWGVQINNDLAWLNSSFHAPLFPKSPGVADAGIGAMTYGTAYGAAGTPIVEYPILQANGATTSARKWMESCPPGYGGSLVVRGYYSMPIAGTANFVLGVRVAALSSGATITSEVFAAQTLGTFTAGAAGVLTPFSMSVSAVDSLTAGLPLNIELERIPGNAGDAEGGTVNIVTVDAYFSLSA